MGILQGLFKARDKPQDALGGSRYSFFFGSTSAGKPVNEQTAMQMTIAPADRTGFENIE